MKFDDTLTRAKKELGQRLEQLRETKGLRAEELARRIKKHRSTIYNHEKGDIGSIDTLAKILWQLDITLDDFLQGFRMSEIPEEHDLPHRQLQAILKSGFTVHAKAATAAIHCLAREVGQLANANPPDDNANDQARSQSGT